MKTIKTDITCPTCNGSGLFVVTIDFPEARDSSKLNRTIHTLRKQGLSLRQIATKVGIKSAGSIAYRLKNER